MRGIFKIAGVFLTVVLLLLMSTAMNNSAEIESQSTDVDFNTGVLENTEVVDTGTDAYIRLALNENGSYATGFDGDGAYVTNPSSGNDNINSIAEDSNYIYVAGYDYSPGNAQWRVEKRDKITGGLVTAFDTDGVVESNPSTGNDLLSSIDIDSGYIYLAGYDRSPGNAQWRIEKRDKTTGALVTAFDTDGVVESNPSNNNAAYSITIDSSYIYVAGYDNSPGNTQWRIEKRDKTTGALVTAFDTDGVVTTNPSTSLDYIYSIAVDSSAIYVGGFDYSLITNFQWRIEKRDKTTGALVTAFDTDGVLENNPSSFDDIVYSISVDSSYIYAAGYDSSVSSSNAQWRVEKRYKNNGTLATAFDTDGVVESNPSTGNDYASSIDIDSNYIYVTGYDISPGDYQWRVEKRYKNNGTLVPLFDNDGVVESNPTTTNDYAYSIVVDSSYIYVGGIDYYLGNSRWRVEKRSITTGENASGFDSDGIVENNPSSYNDYLRSMALDTDYCYLFGDDNYSSSNFQWRLEKRYKKTGALVTAFDSDGVIENNPSSGDDNGRSIAIDSDYIYLAGYDDSPTNFQWRVEKRDKTSGALVTAFDTDGVVESNPSSTDDYAYSIAVDSQYIYIAGVDKSQGSTDSQWRVEKRDKTSGALVTAFDTDGVVESNPSSGNDYVSSLVLDTSNIYVAGYDNSKSSIQWRVEKRDKTTGALVTEFDTDGVVESNPSSGSDNAQAITVDTSYIYVAGYDSSQVNSQWRVEKRDKTTGANVSAFGSNGSLVYNPSSSGETINSIAVDSSSIYLAGQDYSTGNAQWRIEKRDKDSGELDTSFDTDGVIRSNPSTGTDVPYSIAVDSSHIYAAGTDDTQGNYQWRVEKYNNHVYSDHGIYISPLIEAAGADYFSWSTISWTSDVSPPDTMVKFQLAASDDGTNWDYYGPDGTEDTYYETASGQPIWSGLSGKYLKYKAYFTTADPGYSPTLNDVRITYIEVEPPTVLVTSPNGGEDWMKDDFYPITWNAEGTLNSTPVQLFYSADNGATWTAVANWIANTGYYNWTVPNVNTPSALIRINITDEYGNEVSDTSDASFAIDPPPPNWDTDYNPPDDTSPPGGTGTGTESGTDTGTNTGTNTEIPGAGEVKADGSNNDSLLKTGFVILVAVVGISIILNLLFLNKIKKHDKKETEKPINKEQEYRRIPPSHGMRYRQAQDLRTRRIIK